MKSNVKIQMILLLAFFMSLPFSLLSQDDDVKEKQVRIKTVKEVDGKKIVTDTTFIVTDEDNVKEMVKTLTLEIEGDSTNDGKTEVMVDVEIDDDGNTWTTDKNKKVIVMKAPKGHHKVMKFKSGDGDEDETIIVSPHGNKQVFAWTDEDGKHYEYNFEFDMDKFNDKMEGMEDKLKEMQITILDEEGNVREHSLELEELEELEGLDALAELEELEWDGDFDVHVIPPKPPKAPRHYYRFEHDFNNGMEVDDIELRDAGIKNKPDRLELKSVDIDNNDGVIDLSFETGSENPKVVIYNVYGDKVFTGKPELMNGKYSLKADLSVKQPGSYYLMIVSGNSSKTLRIHI